MCQHDNLNQGLKRYNAKTNRTVMQPRNAEIVHYSLRFEIVVIRTRILVQILTRIVVLSPNNNNLRPEGVIHIRANKSQELNSEMSNKWVEHLLKRTVATTCLIGISLHDASEMVTG
jgi:hypothetical protein